MACSDRKGLIFLMLYKANLQDRAVVAIWSVLNYVKLVFCVSCHSEDHFNIFRPGSIVMHNRIFKCLYLQQMIMIKMSPE